MADVTLKYKGATISELSESGSKTIETAGKYCEADILLEYVKSGGGSIASLNILDGVSIYPGYIDANGRPAAQSATNKEYYTDAIDVTPYIGKDIVVGVMTKNGGQHWIGRAFYDESGTFVNRENIACQDSTKVSGVAYRFSVPSSGVKTMRLAWRALTGCVYFAAVYDDTIFSALESIGFGAV